jgi:hypothetical protein
VTPSDASKGLGSSSDERLVDKMLLEELSERIVVGVEDVLDPETDPRSDSEVEPTYLA